MSVTAAVTYISGRAHATPGDASHNEGRVELPPSPWRILRALLATWYERAREVPESTVRSLFDKLAAEPPSFVVPPFGLAHKRHYLPGSAHKAGVSIAPAKVLDGFAAINRSTPLYITWPCELTEYERAAFASLLDELPYLGRAESMVCARLVDHVPSTDGSSFRFVEAHSDSPSGQRPIRLLCPTLPLQWDRLTDVPWKQRQKGQPLPLGAEMVRFGSDRPLVWERTLPTQWAPPKVADSHVIEWMIQGKGKIPITKHGVKDARTATIEPNEIDSMSLGLARLGRPGRCRRAMLRRQYIPARHVGGHQGAL